jgi:ribonuclease P protein component
VEDSSSKDDETREESTLPSEGRYRLTKEDRIRRSPHFRTVTRNGARYRTTHFLIRMLRNTAGRARLGISVGKKAGNACARNRIKRRLREYFRLNRDRLPHDMDIVFIALAGAATLETAHLFAELDRFFGSPS